MSKILFIINSDFGLENSVGARAYPIAKKIKKSDLKIFCRDYPNNLKNNFNLEKVIFQGKFIMQIITAIPIYIYKKFPSNHIRNYLFDLFLLQKLKKEDLSKIKIIHSWDFLPKSFKYIKKINSEIKIIQDLAIALNPILENIPNSKKYFGIDDFEIFLFMKEAFKYIDEFVVPSNFVKDSLLFSKEYSNQKISLVPFGVDLNKFKKKDNFNNKSFNVAFSGNVNYRKGIPYLIKAWKELKLNNAILNIYGRIYPEVSSYLKNSKKYNIKVHGFVNIKKELSKNDLFVFPSLMEGSAKAIYEAMACSMPVITTYNSGSIVRDGIDGFIIPIEDVKKIKEKLLFFYNNRKNIKKFGKNARKNVENYSWEHYSKSISKIYKLK